MSNTITADRRDIGDLAVAYADIMRFHVTGSSFHININSGPRKMLETYLRLSEKLGVKLMDQHCIARITKQIEDEEQRVRDIVQRTFGPRPVVANQ